MRGPPILLGLLVPTLCLAVLLTGCSTPPAPPDVKGQEPTEKTATAPPKASPQDRRIVAAFLTRCGGVPYQTLRYFEPLTVKFSEVPGAEDVAARWALIGQPLPPVLYRFDRLSEALLDNLGQLTRTFSSHLAYVEPVNGQTMAFDIASSAGGVPQRTVGYRTKNGCHLIFYRGGESDETKDIDFQPGTEIFPATLDFVHIYFLEHNDRKEFVRQLFVPEIMGFADVVAKMEGSETVALGGRNYECAKYLVRTSSGRTRTGAFAQQYLWFERQNGHLLKRVDVQNEAGLETLVERVEPGRLEVIAPLVVRPEKIGEDRAFPYPLDRELVYAVHLDKRRLGEIRVIFSKMAADEKGPEGWQSQAHVRLLMTNDQGTNQRQEDAVTRFDQQFRPVSYLATGQESVEAQAEYSILARFLDGAVTLKVRRETRPLARKTAETVASPTVRPAAPAQAWDEPLRRLTLSGESDSQPGRERVQNERFERPLSMGTLIFDYHRIDHLAVALYRLPLPELGKAPDAALPTTRQRLAFYAVRQNLSGVVAFTVTPEPPAKDAAPDQPTLYVAATSSLLMPGQVLLDRGGRILQWRTRYGDQEIVYTLDDPIMRERESHGAQAPVQEGPLLLRPPWY